MFSLAHFNVHILLILAAELYLVIVCFYRNLDFTVHLAEFLVFYTPNLHPNLSTANLTRPLIDVITKDGNKH